MNAAIAKVERKAQAPLCLWDRWIIA